MHGCRCQMYLKWGDGMANGFDALQRLYKCDYTKNTKCNKRRCQSECTMTTNPAFRADDNEYVCINGNFVQVRDENNTLKCK